MKVSSAEALSWMLCALGVGGSVAAWILTPAAFPQAWLAALFVWLGWPLGCMGLIFIHALTGGAWGYAIRGQLVAGLCTLPILPFAVVPWVFVLRRLYPWLRPEVAERLDNVFYLNPLGFAIRGVLYLLLWFSLAALTLRFLRRDQTPEPELSKLAPLGLILLALTITFSSIDWIMSLDPRFPSSVFGMIQISEMGLFALSISIFIAAVGAPPPQQTLATLSRLLQALVILWAYLDFMQLLIVWNSDLPREAHWYAPRVAGLWGVFAALVAALHFLLPFFALLAPSLRQSRAGVSIICALLISGVILRGWQTVLPASHRGFSAAAVAAIFAFAGAAAAIAMRIQGSFLSSTGASRHA
jgi:hypothetical protein